MTISRTERTTERPRPGEGEERIRQALEDGVIARERDTEHRAGWSIADIARDLGISETRAAAMVRADGKVNLRAGQIPMLRARIRAAVLAAIGVGAHPHCPVAKRIRKLTGMVGRVSETYDRAEEDDVIDNHERAELRTELRALGTAAHEAADDLEDT